MWVFVDVLNEVVFSRFTPISTAPVGCWSCSTSQATKIIAWC